MGSIRKASQHLYALDKCKLNPQCETTKHVLKCRNIKDLTILHFDEDVEQLECPHTASGNVK